MATPRLPLVCVVAGVVACGAGSLASAALTPSPIPLPGSSFQGADGDQERPGRHKATAGDRSRLRDVLLGAVEPLDVQVLRAGPRDLMEPVRRVVSCRRVAREPAPDETETGIP